MSHPNLYEAMCHPKLFGKVFASPTFWTWLTVAKLMSGVPLDDREQELFAECTGRSKVPDEPVTRLDLLVGRRGGKDRFDSAVGVHQAALAADWRRVLSAGERGVVLIVGASIEQAAIMRRYCEGLLEAPLIAAEVKRNVAGVVEFRNGSALEVVSNDARLIRGRSAIAVIGTEACHWRTDEDNAASDAELLAAAEPSMAMTPGGGVLILSSSPLRKAGVMYADWRDYWGKDDAEVLVWRAPSQTMNPALPSKHVEAQIARDPVKYRPEYLVEWREDQGDFIPADAVDSATAWTCRERSYDEGTRYVAFTDAAGGTGTDSFAICIAHAAKGKRIIDVIRERKPRFIPANVCEDYAELLRQYKIKEVTGDAFSGGWCASEFERCGIKYKRSDRSKSELYLSALPMLLSGEAVLLDNEKLRRQFSELERKVHSGNRESVDHRTRKNDDLANVVCGGLVLAAAKVGRAIYGCQSGAAYYLEPDGIGGLARHYVRGPRAPREPLNLNLRLIPEAEAAEHFRYKK